MMSSGSLLVDPPTSEHPPTLIAKIRANARNHSARFARAAHSRPIPPAALTFLNNGTQDRGIAFRCARVDQRWTCVGPIARSPPICVPFRNVGLASPGRMALVAGSQSAVDSVPMTSFQIGGLESFVCPVVCSPMTGGPAARASLSTARLASATKRSGLRRTTARPAEGSRCAAGSGPQ